MVKTICVDPKQVDLIWPEVSHWIMRAMERGDLGTFSDVEDDVLSGRALLWLAWDHPNIIAAGVTQISTTEQSKVCTVVAVGGGHLLKWLHSAKSKVENYAKAEGCDVVRILGRKGWQRILKDYSAPKVVLERRI